MRFRGNRVQPVDDEVIDTVIEKPIDDKKKNEVFNALEELIRNIVREEKAKK